MVGEMGSEEPKFAWDEGFLSPPPSKLGLVLKLVNGQ